MQRNHGIALVTALIIMTVVGILVTGVLFNSLTSLTVSGNDRNATLAQYASQAGTKQVLTLINQNSVFVAKYPEDYFVTDEEDSLIAACSDGNYSSMGIDIDRLRDSTETVQYSDGTVKQMRTFDVVNDGSPQVVYPVTLSDGSEVGYDYQFTGGMASVTVRGWVGGSTYDNARARATNVINLRPNGAVGYGNAIFAKGTTGPAINGNLGIYGSVHSVNEANESIAMSGTSGIYNTYHGEGANSDVTADVDLLGGDSNEDQLCAKVKLKTGNLEIESSSTSVGVGTDVDGNGASENDHVIGVYLSSTNAITKKKTGNTTPGPAPSGTVNVLETTSPNNWNPYTDDAELPELPTNYPNDAGFTATPANCPWLFQNTQVKYKDFQVTVKKNGTIQDKEVNVTNTADYAVIPPSLADRYSNLSCGSTDGTISWVPAEKDASGNVITPGYIKADGTINLAAYDLYVPPDIPVDADGDGVQDIGVTEVMVDNDGDGFPDLGYEPDGSGGFVDQNGDGVIDSDDLVEQYIATTAPMTEPTTVLYDGIGTIRTGSSDTDSNAIVGIHGSLVPVSTDSAGNILKNASTGDPLPGNYVEDDLLAFVTSGRTLITSAPGTSQRKIAGVFYSTDITYIPKNPIILGSLVADRVNIGQTVPRIAWDFRLGDADNLPGGLPVDAGNATAGPKGTVQTNIWEKR